MYLQFIQAVGHNSQTRIREHCNNHCPQILTINSTVSASKGTKSLYDYKHELDDDDECMTMAEVVLSSMKNKAYFQNVLLSEDENQHVAWKNNEVLVELDDYLARVTTMPDKSMKEADEKIQHLIEEWNV